MRFGRLFGLLFLRLLSLLQWAPLCIGWLLSYAVSRPARLRSSRTTMSTARRGIFINGAVTVARFYVSHSIHITPPLLSVTLSALSAVGNSLRLCRLCWLDLNCPHDS